MIMRAIAFAILTILAAAPVGADPRLYEAQALRMAGQPLAAERVLDGLLAEQPRRADALFERGVARAEQGRCGNASRDWAQAMAASPTNDVSQAIGTARGHLCAPRPSGWERTLSFRGIADPNYNNATTDRTVDIMGVPFVLSDDARAQERYGFDANLRFGRAFGVSPRLAIIPYVDAGATVVNSKEDTRIRLGFGLDGDWIGQGWSLRAGPVARFEWDGSGNGLTSSYYGLNITGAYDLDAQNALVASAAVGHLNHRQNPNDSGLRARADLAWVHRFDADSGLRIGVGYGVVDKEPAHRTERETRLSIAYTGSINPSMGFEAGLALGEIRGGAVHPVFGERRRDRLVTATLGVNFRSIETVFGTPSIGISHTISNSNIALHDFEKTTLFAGFTRRF